LYSTLPVTPASLALASCAAWVHALYLQRLITDASLDIPPYRVTAYVPGNLLLLPNVGACNVRFEAYARCRRLGPSFQDHETKTRRDPGGDTLGIDLVTAVSTLT